MVGRHADAVFVMVMNGDQAKSVIFGEDGLAATMGEGGIIILTATIKPSEAREIAAPRARAFAWWTVRCPAAFPGRRAAR